MSRECRDFENAEEVWFWFCRSMMARAEGLRGRGIDYLGYIRKCEICDIERLIKRLKAAKLISNRQLRVLIKWGKLDTAPYYDRRAKRSEIRLWESAINTFDSALKAKGIL